MSELIDAISKTREITAEIFTKSLVDIDGNSEAKVKDKIRSEIKANIEILVDGWYNPPAHGIAVLFADTPFERLKYDSLRNPVYWSSQNFTFDKETVALIFFSPVHRKTKMIGDIGFTLYKGDNEKIRDHIRKSYNVILEIAKYAKVGMKFSELCTFASKLFYGKFKPTKWVTISSDPSQSINLGHTVPGSLGKNITFGNSFEEIKENIRTGRVHIINTENFEIPATCAFTVESRLEDLNNPDMPSVYFHFIVCFDEGKKTILENFNKIFNVVGMDYMNSK